MGQGSITRKASDLRPLLLDRFRNAAAAYSLRPLTLSGQDNPVVKVRRSVDNTEQDFNPAQINDGTLEQFVNAGDVAPADYGTGAAAAYSLRHVSDGYTGDVVRVRRSVDNAEADFTATEVSDGTLATWVGAGNDGFVTTWYDQSGNSNDATQATAASQPKIVSGGSLVTENGKPAIDFDGDDDHFGLSSVITTSIYSSFALLKKQSFSLIVIPFGANGGQSVGAWSNNELYENNGSSFVSVSYTNNSNQNLFSVIKSGNTLSDFSANQNGASLGSYSGTPFASISIYRIGARNDTFSNGNIQEAIFYDSDQSSNRELIETNVNHYYSIYSQTNDGFVTTWYDQSGNGNHATQATAASQPKIVSAGSLVVENGKAALDFDGSDDGLITSSYFANFLHQSKSSVFAVASVNSGTNNAAAIIGTGSNTGYSSSQPAYYLAVDNRAPYINRGGVFVTNNLAGQYPVANVQLSRYVDNQQYLITAITDAGNPTASNRSYVYNNGSDLLQNNTNTQVPFSGNSNSAMQIFRTATSLKGIAQEIVIYPTDQSTKRQQIESNLNTYYGIY